MFSNSTYFLEFFSERIVWNSCFEESIALFLAILRNFANQNFGRNWILYVGTIGYFHGILRYSVFALDSFSFLIISIIL